jgi:FAD/FMN-containing dehydrogenase
MALETGPGTAPAMLSAAVRELAERLRGRVLCPGDGGYDEARVVFNRAIDRRPAVIARCAGAADVIPAIDFARAHDLLVAVRGGGHNVTGNAVCDGGIVIDCSDMKGIRVDPRRRIVRAEPGLTSRDVNHDLQTFDLGATLGFVSTTGIAGLTLGGGLGWLVRKHGLACDNLVSADVVTADGRLLRASRSENEDLFWGIRGGGGNLGVVTSFELQAHPVGVALAGLLIYPIERAREALAFYREFAAAAPDELTSAWLLFMAPPAPFIPKQAHGAPVAAIALCYAGPLDAGERLTRPLREGAPPAVDTLRPMRYAAVQTMADVLYPPGLHHYWKSSFLKSLSDEAIETMLAWFASAPSPRTLVLVEHIGDGAASRVEPEDTAFVHRQSTFNFLATSMWSNPADSDRNIDWTQKLWEAMQPFASDGVYVNFLGSEGDDRIKAAYGSAYERLAALKNSYDPDNFFSLNQNIEPTSSPVSRAER